MELDFSEDAIVGSPFKVCISGLRQLMIPKSIFLYSGGSKMLYAKNISDPSCSDTENRMIIKLIPIHNMLDLRRMIESDFYFKIKDSLIQEKRPYFALKINQSPTQNTTKFFVDIDSLLDEVNTFKGIYEFVPTESKIAQIIGIHMQQSKQNIVKKNKTLANSIFSDFEAKIQMKEQIMRIQSMVNKLFHVSSEQIKHLESANCTPNAYTEAQKFAYKIYNFVNSTQFRAKGFNCDYMMMDFVEDSKSQIVLLQIKYLTFHEIYKAPPIIRQEEQNKSRPQSPLKKLLEAPKPKCESYICANLSKDDITGKLRELFYQQAPPLDTQMKEESELAQYPKYKHESFIQLFQCQDLIQMLETRKYCNEVPPKRDDRIEYMIMCRFCRNYMESYRNRQQYQLFRTEFTAKKLEELYITNMSFWKKEDYEYVMKHFHLIEPESQKHKSRIERVLSAKKSERPQTMQKSRSQADIRIKSYVQQGKQSSLSKEGNLVLMTERQQKRPNYMKVSESRHLQMQPILDKLNQDLLTTFTNFKDDSEKLPIKIQEKLYQRLIRKKSESRLNNLNYDQAIVKVDQLLKQKAQAFDLSTNKTINYANIDLDMNYTEQNEYQRPLYTERIFNASDVEITKKVYHKEIVRRENRVKDLKMKLNEIINKNQR
eukprot:403358679